ncbi:MAG: alanine--tRNA ligase, partial [Polyangiales bacterium]
MSPKTARAASQVRSTFLDYFKSHGHTLVPSGPIVPSNDPTLMFASAGMVQFKDCFTGRETRSYSRATSSQKCLRISGKHNDLENVGRTARHHTFFEMLGNFSFGDYFKEEAIVRAWELVTKVYEIPSDRLVVTYFQGDSLIPRDDEAATLWKKVSGLSDDRILGMGAEDNFWSAGNSGPCGPCSEIHYRHGTGAVDPRTFGEEPHADGMGWMEIWNLVFMQFEKFDHDEATGAFKVKPLPGKSVDTGMGLERLTSVVQGVTSNYDTDLLRALVEKAATISGRKYGGTMSPDDVSMRVIADHARTTAFLIAEGIFPDRDGRPYVLRRVMRRAIRHGHRLGIQRPFLHEVASEVVALMGDQYGELRDRKATILEIAEQEEVRFRATIDRGLELIDKNTQWATVAGKQTLPGEVAFKLSDTYGFPLDLTEVIGEERGFGVDHAGYEAALQHAKGLSAGSKLNASASIGDAFHAIANELGATTDFVGYTREEGESEILALVLNGVRVTTLGAGDEAEVIVRATPFYAESGGQVGDRGTIRAGSATFTVHETHKPVGALVVHTGKLTGGALKVGEKVSLEIDHERRSATRRNHSATHLLHYALRTVLGEHVQQKGSLVGPDRLRFDYAHGRAVADDQLVKIEEIVNEMILDNVEV